MDEYWQRYRSFWTPVLIGLGVFLVGLIFVNALTEDPERWQQSVARDAGAVRRKVEPATRKINALRKNEQELEEGVRDWARRLDQAGLADPLETVVADALQAAILRGVDPEALRQAVASPQADTSRDALAPFDDDAVAAGKALARYDETRQDRLNLLRTGDPNVGFSRLLSDVSSELRVRANRADVEPPSDVTGFAGVSSVSREVLAQRLLNLALVAELVDLAIRSRVRSIQEIRLEQRANPLGDEVFLREWPVTFTVRGDMASVRPILARLTDPERPVPLASLALTQPPRSTPLEGQVQLTATAVSVLVRPEASLGLELEER